jgi:calcium/calmodulin-dependent protein kinase I
MFKLVQAVDYMHKQGIMHRDLKLQNIMIRGENRFDVEPIIVDFGIADYVQKEAVYSMCRCGTPGYVAP